MTTDLVKLTVMDGQPMADSRVVAEVLGVQHQNFRELIETRSDALGTIRFETGSSTMPDGRPNPKPERFALLTKRQCLLLITFVRNSEEAVRAKVALIDAFEAIEEKLREVPTLDVPALLARAVIESDKLLKAKDAQIADLMPRAAVANQIADSAGLLTLAEAGKATGLGARNIIDILIKGKALYRDSEGHILPDDQHVKAQRFAVKMKTFDKGRIKIAYPQTFVTGKGVCWITLKFGQDKGLRNLNVEVRA